MLRLADRRAGPVAEASHWLTFYGHVDVSEAAPVTAEISRVALAIECVHPAHGQLVTGLVINPGQAHWLPVQCNC